MRIFLHIGLDHAGADRLQHVLVDKRQKLLGRGVLVPVGPGAANHTRLVMAITDPDHVDPLRFEHGILSGDDQRKLRDTLAEDLAKEVEQHKPDTMILSAPQLGTSLHRTSELERLRSLLAPFSGDIRLVAHVDGQARQLARHYAVQIMDGRADPLERDLALVDQPGWWQACLATVPRADPDAGGFLETQAPPFWLDYAALVEFWEGTFGQGSVTLRPYDGVGFAAPSVTEEIRASFDLGFSLGKAAQVANPNQPSAAWLARCRSLNALLVQILKTRKRSLPRPLWRSFLDEIRIGGDAIAPGSLSAITRRFAADNAALCKAHPALHTALFDPDPASADWSEADPENGYRASQYLLAFMYRIDKATKATRATKVARKAKGAGPGGQDHPRPAKTTDHPDLTPTARAILPPTAIQNFEMLKTSPFVPHNRLGTVNETDLADAYASVPARDLPEGSTGNLIVGCMKNEAPYIVEWVAYHRAIGIDNFLIYTNDCSDGTREILNRLQAMGVLQHRDNDKWRGNSPQQFALNQSLKEPVLRNADWIIHIDVDEFINVRTGNGTIQDFLAVVPDATNVAMTWRLFGHNGVTRLDDGFVIDQFDRCAPKFCPKPHTVWGFKTMFRNIGAYAKISCHRPNKLNPQMEDKVQWVNGSGHDMTDEAIRNGWRNSKRSIGYDLLQLNHYALRSAESFLIKRQRGRALHVDRSIGLNYWIRMDWSDVADVTIKRNTPRMQAEYDRLMQDGVLRRWHRKGLDWHRAKAEELHTMPEFQDLYQQAIAIKLTETERVAYALALDMEE